MKNKTTITFVSAKFNGLQANPNSQVVLNDILIDVREKNELPRNP